MASITDIKAKICQLSPAQFQEFCDDFLFRKGYRNIHSYGMQPGTGKTTIGNPDTYFRLDNGKYVFVAYTTQQAGIYDKLLEDIEKCLDESKTGLSTSNIEEIICFHTSSNLSPGDDFKLHERCRKEEIQLTIYGVDELASQTQANFPSLASKYLHLNIDTNQLVSVEEFVKQYDANKLAAPLDTEFIFRTKEKEDIQKGFLDYEIVIISGKSGVGKTRLALEAAKEFSTRENYRLVCVKNYNMSLYEDLCSLTEQPGNYLLFIDDANDLVYLQEVLSYINRDNSRYHMKLLLTVRDYAQSGVVKIVKKVIAPLLVSIEPFTDKEITRFLNESLGIKNDNYIQQIVRIAEGNPRMAFMAGKLAVEHNKLSSINDASGLYDEYYSTYVDDTFGMNKDLCLTAGIISVVKAVVLSRLDVLNEIFNEGLIKSDSFIENIQLLSRYEVVEIMKNEVASMSDQCLANYMIYYVFFKRKLVPFSLILEIGYKHFHDGVIKSIGTILNIYNNQDTREYCKQEVIKVWKKFSDNNDSCFSKFVNDFHTFNPEESFIYAENAISKICQEEYNPFLNKTDKYQYDWDSDTLTLLEGYAYSDYIEYVIELLVAYCSKSERAMVSGNGWLKANYGVDYDSMLHGFFTQQKVSDALRSMTKENIYARYLTYEWAMYSLGFSFESSELSRNNTLLLHRINIIETEKLRLYRDLCFESLINVIECEKNIDLGIDFLSTYAKTLHDDVDSMVVAGDMNQLGKVIALSKCERIQYLSALERLIKYAENHSISYDPKWNTLFDDERWSLYILLRDDYYNSGLEYDEYQKSRLNRIQEFGKTLNCDTVKSLTYNINSILSEKYIGRNDYYIKNGFEIILQELSSECLLAFFSEYLVNGSAITIRPGVVLTSFFKAMSSQQVLEIIKAEEFDHKNEWMFSFFEDLPNVDADASMKEEFFSFLKEDSDKDLCQSSLRSLRVLDKFLSIDPLIYPKACRIIFEKKTYNEFAAFIYFELLFNEHVYAPKELLMLFSSELKLLQDIYFFMISKGRLEDCRGLFLNEFILQGEEWIKGYAPIFWEKAAHYNDSENLRCFQLWASSNYMSIFNYLFYKFPEGETYTWKLEQAFINSMRNGDNSELVKNHQREWIHQAIVDNSSNERIYIVFKIIHGLDEETRREAIRQFLEVNNDYEVFKNISFLPSLLEGTDSIIPAYKKQIEFLESLFPFVNGAKYLKHKALLVSRIEQWKEMIKKCEIDELCQKIYQ